MSLEVHAGRLCPSGGSGASDGSPTLPVFNAVLTNLANAPKASAQLDVSLESTNGARTPIEVTVYKADGSRDDFRIETNDSGFASTDSVKDLLVASGGQAAIVQARTPQGIETSNALLRQKVQGQKILLGVPNERAGVSTQLSIAVGDIMRGAFLLIANVTDGQPAEVSVHVGSVALPARFSNPELGVHKIWQVALTAAEAQAHIVVRSSVPVIVQLAVDDGKVDEATIVAT